MNGWMLDDGPFGILARLNNASWNWQPASFHLADSVASATIQDKSGKRQALVAQQANGENVVATHAVMAGSDADTTLCVDRGKNRAHSVNTALQQRR